MASTALRFQPLRSLILAVAAALAVVAVAGPALALPVPTGQNITVSPTQVVLNLPAGASAGGVATLINDGDQPYDFIAYSKPYRVTGEDYNQLFTASPGVTDISGWISQPTATIHIAPHQTTTIPYKITVPAGTAGGGYYGVMFYQSLPKPVAGTGVMSQQRIGIVVYLRVEGQDVQKGRVESFSVSFLQPGAPVTATLRLSNEGNVHYDAAITEHVTDVFGNAKADISLTRFILPGTIRRIGIDWAKAPAFGLFRVNGVVQIFGQPTVLPSRYVLVLSANAFVVASGVILLLVVMTVWWWLGRRHQRARFHFK